MYFIVIICVLINLMFFDSVQSGAVHRFNLRFHDDEQEIFLPSNTTDWDIRVVIDKETLSDLGGTTRNCNASCADSKSKYDTNCKFNSIDFIILGVKDIKENITPNWTCEIIVTTGQVNNQDNLPPNQNLNKNKYVKFIVVTLPQIIVLEDAHTSYFVLLGLFALAVVIIIGQCTWITSSRSKAKRANPPDGVWKKETVENEDARYVQMPRQSHEKESVLYEALDSIRDKQANSRAPRPPSLTTLPRSRSTTTLVSSKLKEFVANDWETTGSLEKRKKRGYNAKRKLLTSVERMKTRPPLPLPNDGEVYEDMKCSSPPRQFEQRDKILQTNEEFIPFAGRKLKVKPPQFERESTRPPPKHPMASPSNSRAVSQRPNQHLAQIKQALEHKNLGLGPSSASFRPPTPKAEVSPFLNRRPTEALERIRPPRPKPAPPSKPKQLHPLPPPPLEPTPIPVHTEYAEDSDDEEWTYEPLPNYKDLM